MRYLFILFTILFAPGNSAQSSGPPPIRAVADDTAVFAMMSSNAYLDPSRQLFPLEQLGWRKVDLEGNAISPNMGSYRPTTIFGFLLSNLQFDIWEDTNSKKTIFAFKGSDELVDWFSANLKFFISLPYKSAKKHVRHYRQAHPDRQLTVTGHSLGGGIALSLSFWEGIDAIVFNTSPRIFDGLRNANEPAWRLVIFQENDVLEKIRARYPKFLKKISPEQIIQTHFDYGGRNPHRGDLLAEGLLSCTTEPSLQMMAQRLDLSVKCNIE